MHRVYYTPQRLHRIYPNRSPDCPRCQSPDSTYMHMFWTCPLIEKFWAAIFESINIRSQLTLPVSPELALLGIHEDDQRPRYTKILISLLLYYAKKEVLRKWASPSPPKVDSWDSTVNAVLPLYKTTYTNRGCPQKFNRVWLPWTEQF